MESEKRLSKIIMSILGTLGEATVDELTVSGATRADLNYQEKNLFKFNVRKSVERGVRCGMVQKCGKKYSFGEFHETDGAKKRRKKTKSKYKQDQLAKKQARQYRKDLSSPAPLSPGKIELRNMKREHERQKRELENKHGRTARVRARREDRRDIPDETRTILTTNRNSRKRVDTIPRQIDYNVN